MTERSRRTGGGAASQNGPAQPRRVVIVGGGTAGWMTASALVTLLPHACTARLVESEEIGIVGVGEATLPHLRTFLRLIGIDEAAFMRATGATFKLGIEFRDFGRLGGAYLHPFGEFGRALHGVPFLHYWLRMRALGSTADLFDYSLCNLMAAAERFAPPSADRASPLSTISYAYQLDAARFAPLLRHHAEAAGAARTEGQVIGIERDGTTGDVLAIRLAGGERIAGDLFIDCSGFRSLLLGNCLAEPWDDWSAWLPCDRAVAVPCAAADGPVEPFTRATASEAGWRWRIPLQHRTGNGHVYSSAHMSDEAAAAALLAGLDGPPMADPRMLRFGAGRRRRSFAHNVVGIGLASGFLEPLESTSIYLVQAAILQLIELFPHDRIDPADRDEFNRLTDYEYARIRDFLILHYHATERTDSGFWNDMRTMRVPDSLAEKIELFRTAGRVTRYSQGLFFDPSWIAVYIGQGIIPKRWDQRADAIDPAALGGAMMRLRGQLQAMVQAMPHHRAVLDRLQTEAAE